MSATPSAATFVELVSKSQVVKERDLQRFLASGAIQGAGSEGLARAMIEAGLLTAFQAQHLLKGRTGLVLSKYVVLEQLGSGGAGSIFLARDRRTGEQVALKMLPAELARDQSAVARFQREARAIAALDHPNIVRSLGVDQHAGRNFIVMEYAEGQTLQALVEKEGALPVERALNYVAQAAAGLAHIHEGALIHRDIKPGNLLVDRTGTVKVLDLGLARFVDQRQDELTQKMGKDCMLGTADYISPEQALCTHDADVRSDIYSLGATAYFLLSGQSPFAGLSLTQKLLAAQTRQARPLTELRPEVPEEVAAIIGKMMAREAEERYQTAGEVVEALARVGVGGVEALAFAPSRKVGAGKGGNRWGVWLIVALAGAGLLALAGVGAWWAW